ncbi:MAG: hypothetical protein NVSMB64_18080 [Candidatus Velthaea sp.]
MSVHDRPTRSELIAAVRTYLLDEVVPQTSDRRSKFRARIAANVLAIVLRELESSSADEHAEEQRLDALGWASGTLIERRRELCARVRAGRCDDPAADDALMRYAFEGIEAKLRVSNPGYLRGR